MKKIISVFLFISFVFAVCSCQPQEETSDNVSSEPLKAILIEAKGHSDCLAGEHKSEYELWSSENMSYHQNISLPMGKKINFEGKEYFGVYQHSHVSRYEPYFVDRYQYDDVVFDIRRDTGETIYITIKGALEQTDAKLLTRDECLDIAESFLASKITTSDYQFNELWADSANCYSFKYRRCFGEIMTTEYISVSVSAVDGSIQSYTSTMPNAFSNEELNNSAELIDFLYNGMDDEIAARVNEVYGESENYYGYAVKFKCLTKLDDGSLAVVHEIEAEFRDYLTEDMYEMSGDILCLIAKAE